MDKTLLHLLIIGEAAEDGEGLTRVFRESRYLLKSQRVADRSGLQNALAKGGWDAIIAKNNLPHLRADTALDVLRKSDHDLPFIVFSNRIDDQETVRLLELGVHDVVSENQPARLVVVVSRELSAAQVRRSAGASERARKELEQKLKMLSDSVLDALCYSQDGMHVETNDAYLRLFGYGDIGELEGIPVLNLVRGTDQGGIKECFRRAARGEYLPQTFTGIRKDGSTFSAEMRIRPVQIHGETCQQIAVYDRSAQSAAGPDAAEVQERDPLTGLFCRQGFLARAVETRPDTTLLYFNVSDLQRLNERSGTAGGDEALRRIAQTLTGLKDTLAGRVSGGGFAIMIKTAETSAAITIIESVAGITIRTAAVAPELHEPAEQWLVRAEGYVRRAAGVPPVPTTTKERKADSPTISPDRITVLYQPIVHLHGEAIEQYETVLRHDGLALSDSESLSAVIDRKSIETVVKAAQALNQGGRTVRFFLKPGLAFMTDREQVARLQEIMDGLDPKTIVFEIEEATMAQSLDEITGFIRSAKRQDFGIALDGFGTAIGNIKILTQQPVDFLKIDASLVDNITPNSVNQMIVNHIVALAKKLGKKTIVKSVDNADMLSVLWQSEIDYVQGNYFQEPSAEPNYDFGGEVVSEDVSPNWRPNP